MEFSKITANEAIQLCSREESHFYDRKSADISGKKVQKIVVAFANADGGEVSIGILDDKDEENPEKRWVGFESIEDMNSLLQAVFTVTPALDLRYRILSCEHFDGYVLHLQIEKTSEVHETSGGEVYQRHGAQSLPIKGERITQLSFAKGATTYEDNLIRDLAPDHIIDSEEITSFLSDYSPNTDALDFCINQNLFNRKDWTPRVAAGLLFDNNPSAVLPKKCAVKITRYKTKESESERESLSSQFTVEGPLYKMIHESVKRITEIMSDVHIMTPDGLQKLDYPPEALWEVFVNAVIHRDYSISDDIHVLIYDNRIEIISPGRLPGYVNVENILEARYARNPKIVRTLNRYKDAPNKDMGEGLNTTFQKMREWGLRPPIINEEENRVKVTLPHVSLATPSEAILEFLTKQEKITNRNVRDLTNIKSENMVKLEFYKLRDEGILERVPGLKGSKSAWRLTSKGTEIARKMNAKRQDEG